MSLARLVVTAVTLEGRTKSEVARDYGVSRRWVHELVRRFEAEGEAGLEPRSRRPKTSPQRIDDALEREIVKLREHLSGQGLDAGAHTIAFHLERTHGTAPSVSTIWRVLKRRGFVDPQPQKRPRSSFVRFEAAMPNERWQADTTHWHLADGADVEILNVLDDHSRFLVASWARVVFKAADVVEAFHGAAAAHGLPASLLTDNGAVFTAAPRGGGRCAIELECDRLGVRLHHSSPYHPQTCGKVERFHQTLKKALRARGGSPDARRAPGAARYLRRLLQRGEAPPWDRQANAGGGLRRPSEGGPERHPGPGPLQGPAGPDRLRWCGHAASRQPVAPHQGRKTTCRDPGADARRRSRHTHRERGRGTDPGARAGSVEALPGDGNGLNVERCPGTRVNDVPRHHTVSEGGFEPPRAMRPLGPQPSASTMFRHSDQRVDSNGRASARLLPLPGQPDHGQAEDDGRGHGDPVEPPLERGAPGQ